MKVDIWTDIVCPFCYIGYTQFTKALDNFTHKDQVEVVHHSFQLQPDAPVTPSGKKSYEDLAALKGESVPAMKARFKEVSAAGKNEGLTMNMLETVTVNTFDGHQLIHFAAKHGKQEEAVDAMYKAYFTNTANIADREVLVSIVKELGLDEAAFEASLDGTEFVDAVNSDIQKAASLGVRGVPFFVLDDTFGVSGAQGREAFTAALNTAWKESHPLHMIQGDDTAAMVCTDKECA